MQPVQNWGPLVAKARDAAGLTQAQLAEEVKLDASMISKIEANKAYIEPDVFRRLTSALRALSPVELVNELGYELTTPAALRLPKGLVQDLLDMTEQELDAVALLVRRGSSPTIPRAGQSQ